MPDMRDELVGLGEAAITRLEDTADQPFLSDREHAEAVLDSLPRGSFKLDDKTWVRLEKRDSDEYDRLFDHYAACGQGVKGGCGDCTKYARTYLKETFYTEVDHAE